MRISPWLGLLVLCLFPGPPLKGTTSFGALDGQWQLVAQELRGQETQYKEPWWVITISGNQMETDTLFGGKVTSTIGLDMTSTPYRIDFTNSDSSGKTTSRGIFKFADDGLLIICLRLEAFARKGRPKEFKTEGDESLLMLTFERIDKRQKPKADR